MKQDILVSFVKSSLEKGSSKEEVFKQLLDQGKTVDEIIPAFEEVKSPDQMEETQKRTVQLIVSIGALLIGAGVFSFIAANWADMSRFVKVSVILIAMIVSYLGGYFLKEKRGYARTGDALYLLGCIIFGSGVFLVAQMYNIRANWPDGLLLWLIGSVVVAFAVESTTIHFLAIILGLITIIAHPSVLYNSFGYDPYMLTSTALLLVVTIVLFVAGTRMRKKVTEETNQT